MPAVGHNYPNSPYAKLNLPETMRIIRLKGLTGPQRGADADALLTADVRNDRLLQGPTNIRRFYNQDHDQNRTKKKLETKVRPGLKGGSESEPT
ncbi:hypothetical protein EVAR_63975_1 [Eumeta japonica]|uniref:Uncharacterized protein n=1 Tax=Eumeta variegata TaxID=151549 RepID=A0A4C1ZH01_EUMVA|nr:hypothetical protein EVAR_63975_1 [Eumeta japonica]